MLPRHGWSVEATECHQHLDDKVGHRTFEEVEVALQGHLYSFAFFPCDVQPLHEHLPCFALRITTRPSNGC